MEFDSAATLTLLFHLVEVSKVVAFACPLAFEAVPSGSVVDLAYLAD